MARVAAQRSTIHNLNLRSLVLNGEPDRRDLLARLGRVRVRDPLGSPVLIYCLYPHDLLFLRRDFHYSRPPPSLPPRDTKHRTDVASVYTERLTTRPHTSCASVRREAYGRQFHPRARDAVSGAPQKGSACRQHVSPHVPSQHERSSRNMSILRHASTADLVSRPRPRQMALATIPKRCLNL